MASNSGEEKDNLDHSATGDYTLPKGKLSTVHCTSKHLGVTWKFWVIIEPATFVTAVCSPKHWATETSSNWDVWTKIFKKLKVKSNRKFYKCTVVSQPDLHSSLDSSDTQRSVVAPWNADQNDARSNLLSFLLYFFYFKMEGYGFKSSVQ